MKRFFTFCKRFRYNKTAVTVSFFVFVITFFSFVAAGISVFGFGHLSSGIERVGESIFSSAHASFVSTTLNIRNICGNSVVESPEVCDDGINNGLYSSSISGRNCSEDCLSFAPYCGDSILQQLRGEACDDGNNTSGDGCVADCTAAEDIEEDQPSGGTSGTFFGGSFSAPPPTRIAVEGLAYPNSQVTILRDGTQIGTAQAGSDASFSFQTNNVSAGVSTFGFWSEDAQGLRSITFTFTINVVANAQTTITGVHLPPTLEISDRQVTPGNEFDAFGTTVPQATVETLIGDEDISLSTSSDIFGAWNIPVDTEDLRSQSFHSIKARFSTEIDGQTIESGYGRTLSFFVGEGEEGVDFCTRADINDDEGVNLTDFSILLFNFGTSNDGTDINIDGTVNLADFSIMLFCWTG